jgi:phospholipid/cholesterol/gamma-HCH transport system substrate-binding protein
VFSSQDAHGPIRRGLVVTSCSSLGLLQNIGNANPVLGTLSDLLNPPSPSAVCPGSTQAPNVPPLAATAARAPAPQRAGG